MMTQSYASNHTYSPISAVNPFSHNDFVPFMQSEIAAEKKIENNQTTGETMKDNNKKSHATNKMPLWPSLAEIQPEMENAYSWKQQIKQVLQCRSVFIGTMLAMTGLGFMLIF